ncbi:SDR family NAD(P)-dependent oxidoreductase [Mycobacterium sherrisii]|uniref:SDR family NAD(P)-dependent oxidoreductase n=1 Tax=Mycobacterium sherrisii TaxID=243061 RepID=UPI001B80C8B6|nr:SDR family NAD(P)-dependent oxidoreductase [Mycobacterium sherrisii]
MTAPILVVGATGRHGGTGTTVVHHLLRDGHAVRALVRADDARAGRLRGLGVTTVVGDLHDRASLLDAVRDVRAVYFTYPIAAGIVSAAANLSSTLLAVSPDAHLVVMSMAVSAVDSPSKLGQAQAVAEEVFGWAGLHPTVLRFGALFHENLSLLHGTTIRENGLIANSFGDSPTPWIGGDDAAEIAVAHLVEPPPESSRISYPPPAEVMTHGEVARIISAETGRHIRYESISAAQWRRHLEGTAQANPGGPVNMAMAQHIQQSAPRCPGGPSRSSRQIRKRWPQYPAANPCAWSTSSGIICPTSPGRPPARESTRIIKEHSVMSSVLITGANRGIGRAVADEFARRGYRVVATARDPATLADVDAHQRLALDVTDDASVREAVQPPATSTSWSPMPGRSFTRPSRRSRRRSCNTC